MVQKRKVLVIDDDQAILEVIRIILEEKGYDVKIHPETDTIAETVAFYSPDIILVDSYIGGIEGEDVIHLLRSKKESERIPIILVSARHDIEDVAKKAHATDFLPKPFNIDDLAAKIEIYI